MERVSVVPRTMLSSITTMVSSPSRGSDRDIYRERKQLGANIVDDLLKMLGGDLDNTVFSFIPNTAEVAYNGRSDATTTTSSST